MTVEALMREALAEAEAAGADGEHPIGAVVALGGEIVGRGRARQRAGRSQLAHAELEALAAGASALQSADGAILVTTLEPCAMCLAAAAHSGVVEVVYALADPEAESARLIETSAWLRGRIRSCRGAVLEAEARSLLERFEPRLLERLGNGE